MWAQSRTASLSHLQEESLSEPDVTDRATLETDRFTELRERARKLIAKIDSALGRIEIGTYGYCAETDEPIGVCTVWAPGRSRR